jgi:hypothetical protein
MVAFPEPMEARKRLKTMLLMTTTTTKKKKTLRIASKRLQLQATAKGASQLHWSPTRFLEGVHFLSRMSMAHTVAKR